VKLSSIGLVFRKELRETLRDRRTLFIMIGLPILLYPALMLGVTSVAAKRVQRLEDRIHRVAVVGDAPELLAHLEEDPAFRPVMGEDDATAAVREKRADVALLVSPGFSAALADGTPAPIEIVYSHAEERSLAARTAMRRSLEDFRDGVLVQRLGDENLLRPIETEESDVSGVSASAVFASRVLGMFLVLMMLTAAFYPAVDLGAGEKERGTLETLLVAPVGRAEIVIGKYLTVLTVSLGAAALNLVAMGLTFSTLAGMMARSGSGSFDIGFGTLAAMVALLVPLAALFSAASLALSAFARSYKEGMHYLTPLAVVVTPLALVAALPDMELDAGLALMPVTGSVLHFRDLLLGRASLLYGALAFLSSGVVAGAVLAWCVGLFRREDILFRPASGGGLRALRAEARRRGVPNGGEAVLVFVGSLALMWFLGARVMSGGVIRGHLLNQLLVIAGPAVAYALAAGFRPRETFSLRLGRTRILAAAALLGPGLAVLLSEGAHRLGLDRADDVRHLSEVLGAILALPLGLRLLLIAVLPAICEETLFRGFVLTGFRRSMGPVKAAVLCGILFGVFHLSPSRIPATALLGVLLALLTLRAGSILPAVLGHALYNGTLGVLAGEGMPDGLRAGTSAGLHAPLVLAAAALAVAAGTILVLVGDRGDVGARPGGSRIP
jgi:sodium transport system permease protein